MPDLNESGEGTRKNESGESKREMRRSSVERRGKDGLGIGVVVGVEEEEEEEEWRGEERKASVSESLKQKRGIAANGSVGLTRTMEVGDGMRLGGREEGREEREMVSAIRVTIAEM